MAARPDPTLTEEIGRGIHRVRRLILQEASRRLEERGESLFIWQILNFLDRCGPQMQSELAEGTGQHPTGLSRLLEEMEREGLVQRARDSRDRRKVRVEPTATGRRRLRAGRPSVHSAVEQVLEPLGMGERRTLRDLLQRLLDV
ncbi:MAG: winged helix-turn-helix transcriptional regulator [Deltaproteobacteria bacterium]|nr:MAG: winged helix-turn-helix transcriptional regulator [Deltaproteobacteria bacterium]